MIEPFSILGAVASAITVVEATLKSARSLHRIIAAIRAAPQDVSYFLGLVNSLADAFQLLNDNLEARSRYAHDLLPSEKKHYDSVVQLLENCQRDLGVLQQKASALVADNNAKEYAGIGKLLCKVVGKPSNAATALSLYLQENSRRLAQLERILPVLHYSVHTIFLLPSYRDTALRDQALEIIRKIPFQLHGDAEILPYARFRSDQQRTTYVADYLETETDARDVEAIKTWEESAISLATAVVTQDMPHNDVLSDPSTISSSTTGEADSRGTSHLPNEDEIRFRYIENKALVAYFEKLKLHYQASIYQKKGIQIREQLDLRYGVTFTISERAEMSLQLVDILLATGIPDSVQEGRRLLENLNSESGGLGDNQKLGIKLKLGKVYLRLQLNEEAITPLRQAHAGYISKNPRTKEDVSAILEITALVSEAYKAEGNIAESRAWEKWVAGKLGPDYKPPSEKLKRALCWCRAKGFDADGTVAFDHIFDEKGNSPLHEAARDLDIDPEVLQEILSRVDSLEGRDEKGDTALLIAAGGTNKTTVQQLLNFSADVHVRSEGCNQQTPLHRCQDPEIAALLLDKMLRRRNSVRSEDLTNGGSDVPEKLDESNQAFVNSQDCYGRSPLHYACMAGNRGMVEFLLSHGADTELESIGDGTPLLCACTAKTEKPHKKAVVQMLIGKGANPKAKSANGQTAADALKQRFTPDEVKRLLQPAPTKRMRQSDMHRQTYSLSNVQSRKSSMATTISPPLTPRSVAAPEGLPKLEVELDDGDFRLEWGAENGMHETGGHALAQAFTGSRPLRASSPIVNSLRRK